jgi:uncharacterized DUF497 family protein
MKTILFRNHARERMSQNGVTEASVLRAVRDPEWTAPDPYRPGVERRFIRAPELGGRVLRVACIEESDHIRVLSAHPDRNARPPDASSNDL